MKLRICGLIATFLLIAVAGHNGNALAQRIGAVPLWSQPGPPVGTSSAPPASYLPIAPTPSGQGGSSGTQTTQEDQSGSGEGINALRVPESNVPHSQVNIQQQRQRPTRTRFTQQEPIYQPYIEERSAFEDYILTGTPAPLSFDIRQFGYDLFRQPTSSLTPDDNAPVGRDYIVGPGDEILVNVWGSVEGNWRSTVERNGTVNFPKIGVVGVTGLTYEALKTLLQKELAKYYTDFQMSVSLGQLRSMRLYVTGSVSRPGEYVVPSLATLTTTLLQAGGPNKNGTLRDIQVKRGDRTIARFDLYNLLLKGNKTNDIRLMPEDVIFVPPVGPLVGIAGNVRNPAIYELKGPTHLTDVITMAGGLRGLAFKGRVQVQRVADHQYITVLEGDLLDMQTHPEKNILLQDGDLVKIFAVAEAKNLVTVTGAVRMPGEYGVDPGVSTVKELLGKAGGLQYYAASQAELTRLTATPQGPSTEIYSLDVQKALDSDPDNNLVLEKNDYLLVRSVPQWPSQQQLPGDMSSAIQPSAPASAAYPTTGAPGIYPGVALDTSAGTSSGAYSAAPGSAGGPAQGTGPSSPWQLHQKVSLSGEIKYPGVYAIRTGETLATVLQRAGGFTSSAFLKGAVFTRVSVRDQQQQYMDTLINKLQIGLLGDTPLPTSVSDPKSAALARVKVSAETQQKQDVIATLKSVQASGRMVVKLEPLKQLIGTPFDLALENGDTLYIPKDPHSVMVRGEVFHEAAITQTKGMGYDDYINLCGGYTAKADKERIYIVKYDGSAIQPKKGFISWNNNSNKWEVRSEQVESGDTVVVPLKLDVLDWPIVNDFIEIFFHMATTAGVIFRVI